MTVRRWGALLVAGVAVLVLLVARQAGEPADAPVAGAPSDVVPRTVGDVRARLAALPVVERQPRGGPRYERDAFGPAWADVDGNGCNQRDDVLLRDAVTGSTRVQQQGGCDHDVLAGTWVAPYTDRRLSLDDLKDPRQAQAVQIDHVVPLAEAWISGASAWDDDRRRDFANNLDGLLAADGPTNASKGSDDPAAWRPRAAYQCDYAVRWIEVKARWRLGVDASEAAALDELLDRCG